MGVLCTVVGHRRDRKRAWHDGLDWRASCVRCGTAMIKDEAKSKWRPCDRDADFNVRRGGKPEH